MSSSNMSAWRVLVNSSRQAPAFRAFFTSPFSWEFTWRRAQNPERKQETHRNLREEISEIISALHSQRTSTQNPPAKKSCFLEHYISIYAYTYISSPWFVRNSLDRKRPIEYNIYLTKLNRIGMLKLKNTEDRRQNTGDSRQPVRHSLDEVGNAEGSLSFIALAKK